MKISNELLSFPTGSNEILGRALVGSSKDIPLENRALFDDLMRSKSATAAAQWISLTDPTLP